MENFTRRIYNIFFFSFTYMRGRRLTINRHAIGSAVRGRQCNGSGVYGIAGKIRTRSRWRLCLATFLVLSFFFLSPPRARERRCYSGVPRLTWRLTEWLTDWLVFTHSQHTIPRVRQLWPPPPAAPFPYPHRPAVANRRPSRDARTRVSVDHAYETAAPRVSHVCVSCMYVCECVCARENWIDEWERV